MYRRTHLVSLTIFVATVCGLTLAVSAQERDRSKVSDKYTWDLTHIYASDEAWRAAKDKLSPSSRS